MPAEQRPAPRCSRARQAAPSLSSAKSTTSHMRQCSPNWSHGPPKAGPRRGAALDVRDARHWPLTCRGLSARRQRQAGRALKRARLMRSAAGRQAAGHAPGRAGGQRPHVGLGPHLVVQAALKGPRPRHGRCAVDACGARAAQAGTRSDTRAVRPQTRAGAGGCMRERRRAAPRSARTRAAHAESLHADRERVVAGRQRPRVVGRRERRPHRVATLGRVAELKVCAAGRHLRGARGQRARGSAAPRGWRAAPSCTLCCAVPCCKC